MKDFCGKVILLGDCSTETPMNHFIEPLSSILNFAEKRFYKELAKEVEMYIISSTQTHMIKSDAMQMALEITTTINHRTC